MEPRLVISMPGLAEIAAGLEASDSREKSWKVARRRLGKLICWPFDKAAAYEYGRIFAELKRRGVIIQQIDIQIAAISLALWATAPSFHRTRILPPFPD